MKILISIANFGDKQLNYLNTVIDEYRSYKKYDITINVHSTVKLDRNDICLIYHDPTSVGRVAYLHRQEFVDLKNEYDMFLFSENDILIKEEAIDTYLKYNSLLPVNYCLGFIRYEKKSIDNPLDKNFYCLDQWPRVGHINTKNITVNENSYFILQNPFQSCFLLSQDRLNFVINNHDFLKTDYNGIESSSGGIYVNWGNSGGVINKVCTRNLEDLKKCLIHHLPDRHCNTPYPFGADFCEKISTFDSLIKDLEIT